jgi:MoaA/NifB/PqqE/SkfB family radical SAM enzyme
MRGGTESPLAPAGAPATPAPHRAAATGADRHEATTPPEVRPDPGVTLEAHAQQARTREPWWQWLKRTVQHGGPGQCIFAISNACNARCRFCNFALDELPRAAWRYVPLEDACRAIDILDQLFVRYLIVSGGEPTLHPELDGIIAHARRRHMAVLLVTNGSRLTPERCRELVAAGVSSMVISIDAASAMAHEKNRGLTRVCERIRSAVDILKSLGIQSTASVTMSRLIPDYEALAAFLRELGFPAVTFSYPLTHLPSSFLGYREAPLIQFTGEELDAQLEAIKRLKRSFAVVNPTAAIEEMQRFVRGDRQRFACLGGYRYFYLDWNLQVWRCHSWDEPMCSIFELDESRYVRDGCTKCMVDCYRDASVMQHVAVSATDAVRDLRAGHPVRAATRLVRRENLQSIGAALETQSWIRGL